MPDLTIRNLIERIPSGDIRIPAFQRDFVWAPDQVAFLMDSIYKGFPIGTVIFWQTDERLESEKYLGSFKLPDPRRDYPVNYVLDGQQRLTSLFGTFQTSLVPEDNSWVDIFFDMEAASNPQDSCFYALTEDEVEHARHFPIKTFFETIDYRNATSKLTSEQIVLVDNVQEKFKEYRIQNQTFETADRNDVAIVFERINRAGTELNMFELLSAWSWSDDFDLIEKFQDLQDKISEHGFEELSDDRDLQLRICAAIITGETSAKKILDLQGEDIRTKFDSIEMGILGAIDFLKRELKVTHYKMLPFPRVLVPLSTFFANGGSDGANYSDAQRKTINKWFWRSIFTRRFSSDVTERQASDINDMKALLTDEHHEFRFPKFEVKIDFEKNRFSSGTANSKSLILMLANQRPHSFLSGATIDTSKVLKKGSQHEFHHIFPRKYLESQGVDIREINSLANICFLTRSDNNTIKVKPPGMYFEQMSKQSRENYLQEAFCCYDDGDLLFDEFVSVRAKRLIARVYELCEAENEGK